MSEVVNESVKNTSKLNKKTKAELIDIILRKDDVEKKLIKEKDDVVSNLNNVTSELENVVKERNDLKTLNNNLANDNLRLKSKCKDANEAISSLKNEKKNLLNNSKDYDKLVSKVFSYKRYFAIAALVAIICLLGWIFI